jgi:WD40 repeat protein
MRFWPLVSTTNDDSTKLVLKPVTSVSFSADNELMAVATKYGTVQIRTASDGTELATITGFHDSDSQMGVAFSAGGDELAAASAYGQFIHRWNVRNGTPLFSLNGPLYRGKVSYSPVDNNLLAVSLQSNRVALWNLKGSPVSTTLDMPQDVNDIIFSPKGSWLAIGVSDGTLRWKPATESMAPTLPYTAEVTAIAFTPDEKLIALGASDGTIQIWSLADGSRLRSIPAYTKPVRAIAFSPDGQILASSSEDNPGIHVWRVADGTAVTILGDYECTYFVYGIAFSPNGLLLAAGSSPRNLCIWQISGWKRLISLAGHSSSITSVVFSPDGKLIATGSYDGTARLWGIPPQ